MTAESITSAGAFRQVDALTGRVAEAEKQRDEWCQRCVDALRERNEARALYEELRLTYAERTSEYITALNERDQARNELAIARAVGSRQGW
jgi:hypothetical protein